MPTFTIEIDGEDPTNSAPPTTPAGGTVRTVDPQKFQQAMAKGKLKIVGLVLGELPGASLDASDYETAEAEPKTLAGQCIVVYVGGSAYKICM